MLCPLSMYFKPENRPVFLALHTSKSYNKILLVTIYFFGPHAFSCRKTAASCYKFVNLFILYKTAAFRPLINAAHPEVDTIRQVVFRQVAQSRLFRGTQTNSAYCCSRQGLTGFTDRCCTGPTSQRPLPAPYLTISRLAPGIRPCYSGLQVQGTAGSPSGTANW